MFLKLAPKKFPLINSHYLLLIEDGFIKEIANKILLNVWKI